MIRLCDLKTRTYELRTQKYMQKKNENEYLLF
jgi:hypothetical protein